jgi:prepilin-type N-terminal cleavage/methylation domain-containing protein
MRRVSSASPSSPGFTLLEVLVALTLFAVLTVLLFGGLRFGMRASAVGTAQLERSAEIASAAGFLRSQLADAQPLEQGEGAGRRPVDFDGTNDAIDFVASLPAHLAPGGWHRLHLGLEAQDGGQLVIRWEPLHATNGGDSSAAQRRSVLLDGVKAVEFGFFGTLGERRVPTWQERWRGAPVLPALVRMRVTFADGGRAAELVIALRAASPDPELY